MRKPVRRVVVLATQVVVLSLTTAPVLVAHAASDEAAEAAAQEEQVSVRVTNGRIHATVRTEVGRVAGIAYAESPDAAEWRVLDETVTTATEGGVAHIEVDLDAYADQSVILALVTSGDGDFSTDLRATEVVEIVLQEGDLYTADDFWGDKSPLAIKGRGAETALKGFSSLGDGDELAEKGLSVSLKGVVIEDPRGDF